MDTKMNNENTIYKRIYNELREKKIEKIRYSDFYELLENYRLDGNGKLFKIADEMREELLEFGMLEKHAKELEHWIKRIKYYRLTLHDKGLIEKKMKELGMIKYVHPGWIYIINDTDLTYSLNNHQQIPIPVSKHENV
jgi:hypothetical protein